MSIFSVVHKMVQNAASGGDQGDRKQHEGEDKPGGAAKPIVGWLSDAEGLEEGGREGVEELHGIIVRCRFRRGASGAGQAHPIC